MTRATVLPTRQRRTLRGQLGLVLFAVTLTGCSVGPGEANRDSSQAAALERRYSWQYDGTELGGAVPPARFVEDLPFVRTTPSRAPARAVTTFESAGLYWSPDGGTEADSCQVRFREMGSDTWRAGLPLWYDAKRAQCRGSLVHLTPGTAYEAEVAAPDSGEFATVRFTTWSEDFPVGETMYLPETSDRPLVIERSGRSDGYLLVAPAPGKSATIDVAGRADRAIVIKGSYVILRGLAVRGARRHLIVLGKGAHDVVIEDNDLSQWGDNREDGWGVNYDSAIYAKGRKNSLERVVIQRNKIHHPRSNANAWDQRRTSYRGRHPRGPQAITLWNSRGNHVIRYNEIYSDDTHKFNDCIGAGTNFSDVGFPHRDSDIYSNRISHCWDDAIEAEGGNINVRIWGNYIDMSYVMIASAPTEIGPAYVWRNVAYRSRRTAKRTFERSDRGFFMKIQNKHIKRKKRVFGGGRIYVFNNTLLQCGQNRWGVKAGPSDLRGGRITNLVTRNNIFLVSGTKRPSIADNKRSKSNDFDYDLYNGRIIAASGQQQNGIQGAPVFVDGEGCGEFALRPDSPGHDAGVAIPNFADRYRGRGPDMGAQEIDAPRLEFGPDAYRRPTGPGIS